MKSQTKDGSKPTNTSSQSQLLTDGPLNTYQDFKNVFNAKHLGPKSNRRLANVPTYLSSDNLREKEDKSIRSSSHSIKGNQGQVGGGVQQTNISDYKQEIQLNPITPSSMSARERVL